MRATGTNAKRAAALPGGAGHWTSFVSAAARTKKDKIVPIVTDTDGLISAETQVPAAGKGIPIYYAAPENVSDRPVILVMHQIYGRNDYTRDICRRLAKLGYLAILPDLYHRYGSTEGLSREQIREGIAAAVEDEAVLSDLDQLMLWAVEKQSGDGKRMAIIGFAWGAQFVWLYCAHNPAIKAGVCWYGRLVRDSNPKRPTPWRTVVASLKAPVLGIYAGTDPNIPPEALVEMRPALARAPVETKIQLYPDAKHGFHADYQPQYWQADANDAWSRQLEWLKRFGL